MWVSTTAARSTRPILRARSAPRQRPTSQSRRQGGPLVLAGVRTALEGRIPTHHHRPGWLSPGDGRGDWRGRADVVGSVPPTRPGVGQPARDGPRSVDRRVVGSRSGVVRSATHARQGSDHPDWSHRGPQPDAGQRVRGVPPDAWWPTRGAPAGAAQPRSSCSARCRPGSSGPSSAVDIRQTPSGSGLVSLYCSWVVHRLLRVVGVPGTHSLTWGVQRRCDLLPVPSLLSARWTANTSTWSANTRSSTADASAVPGSLSSGIPVDRCTLTPIPHRELLYRSISGPADTSRTLSVPLHGRLR